MTTAAIHRRTTDKIRALRARLHITQQQLADLIPCHLETVRRWEQGRCVPGRLAAARLRALEE